MLTHLGRSHTHPRDSVTDCLYAEYTPKIEIRTGEQVLDKTSKVVVLSLR